MARIAEAAGPGLIRVTFAEEGMSLHSLAFKDGGGAYVSQSGAVVARWQSQWERPELWLFDFHHHLFAGETGELVSGIAGLVGFFFLVSGVILWWRTRRAFRLRLLPQRWAPGPIVAHHRDLGVIVSPLLFVSLATGVLMLFEPLRTAVLGSEERPREVMAQRAEPTPAAALALAAERFPGAEIRRLSLPRKDGDPVSVRLRQPFEWTPNGRTQLGINPDGSVFIEDAARANGSASLAEKAYPLHAAKVGGLLWAAAMTLSGLALAMLGSFTTWTFWRRQAKRPRQRKAGDRAGPGAGFPTPAVQ
jgi:uncharacterized iron-regulated membrane protein